MTPFYCLVSRNFERSARLELRFHDFIPNLFFRMAAYLNIPMQNILYECSDTTLAHFIKQYSLNPPETPDL